MSYGALIQSYYKSCPMPKEAPIIFNPKRSIYQHLKKRSLSIKRRSLPSMSSINSGHSSTTKLLPLGTHVRSHPPSLSSPSSPSTLSSSSSSSSSRSEEVGSSKDILAVFLCGIHHDQLVDKYIPFIKEKYPPEWIIPNGLEDLCFPDSDSWSPHTQAFSGTYNIILTQRNGTRSFGFCRRIIPEGDSMCLPLALCILSKQRDDKELYSEVLHLLCLEYGKGTDLKPMLEVLPHLDQESLRAYKDMQMGSFRPAWSLPVSCGSSPRTRNSGRISSRISLDHLLLLFSSAVQEKKILLLSDNIRDLCATFDSLEDLLHPLLWQHLFIPVLPKSKWDILDAPTPFLIGILLLPNPSQQDCGSMPSKEFETWTQALQPHLIQEEDCLVVALANNGHRGSIALKTPGNALDLPLPRPLLLKIHKNLSRLTWTDSSYEDKFKVLSKTLASFFSDLIGKTPHQFIIQDSCRSQPHVDCFFFCVERFLQVHEDSECYEFLVFFVRTALFVDWIRKTCHISSNIDLKRSVLSAPNQLYHHKNETHI
ncbi:DENN domain-containing protein 2C-like isoform X2 [Tigriopus californicus]|uniref:DENN domain-containing protein 2C-like isoform X2 n=1 Tax=Tigriopus californicus TaxID=6832 RepID=UPI0027DA011E|nr:DENN domain-containing protein 2C-like isoform X2 [Tigriopus californicus]